MRIAPLTGCLLATALLACQPLEVDIAAPAVARPARIVISSGAPPAAAPSSEASQIRSAPVAGQQSIQPSIDRIDLLAQQVLATPTRRQATPTVLATRTAAAAPATKDRPTPTATTRPARVPRGVPHLSSAPRQPLVTDRAPNASGFLRPGSLTPAPPGARSSAQAPPEVTDDELDELEQATP